MLGDTNKLIVRVLIL